MKPETRAYLDKALEDLDEAKKIEGIGPAKAAARSAYHAVFHAAEALIFELTGKITKSHSGVRSEFARLAREITEIDRTFPTFLAKAYKYKEISDYGIGADAIITIEAARDAVGIAERFIYRVTSALTTSL